MYEILIEELKKNFDDATEKLLKKTAKINEFEKILDELFCNNYLVNLEEENDEEYLKHQIKKLENDEKKVIKDMINLAVENKNEIIDSGRCFEKIRDQMDSEIIPNMHLLVQQSINNNLFLIEQKKINNLITKDNIDKIKNENSIFYNIEIFLNFFQIPLLSSFYLHQKDFKNLINFYNKVRTTHLKFPKIFNYFKIYDKVNNDVKKLINKLIKVLDSQIDKTKTLDLVFTFITFDFLDLFENNKKNNVIDNKYEFFLKIYLDTQFNFLVKKSIEYRSKLKYENFNYLNLINIYSEHVTNFLSFIFILLNFNNTSEFDNFEKYLIFINEYIKNITLFLSDEIKVHIPLIVEQKEKKKKSEFLHEMMSNLINFCESLSKFNYNIEVIILSELSFNLNLIDQFEWDRLKRLKR